MSDPVACEGLTRRFQSAAGETVAVNGVSLCVGAGELVALIGASGSGKTTLLGLLGGLDEPDEGRIFVQGHDFAELDSRSRLDLRRSAIGFVFQAAGLIPLMTAAENVALALEITGSTQEEALRLGMVALEQVGLADRARHRTYKLSGGEQQPDALARAIVKHPAVLLADEPTGQLDSETGAVIFTLLRSIASSGTAVLIATHDETFAAGADRTLTLVDGAIA